jgi:uncharacterized membrane protein
MPPVRQYRTVFAGRRTHLLAYLLQSLALIGWVIAAARRTPYVGLWPLQRRQALVPLRVTPVAAWFVIVGFAESNPLSISVRSTAETPLGFAVAITRHPILWGFQLWAATHIPPNGDVVTAILFRFLAGFSIERFFILDRWMRRRLRSDRWEQLAQKTSMVPVAALIGGRAKIRCWRPLVSPAFVAALCSAWFILQGHRRLIGIDPLAGLR